MSEAYECDRCGKCRPGAPYRTVGLGVGVAYQRTAPAFENEWFNDHGEWGPYTDAVDLCASCWNDFKRYWQDGGGEAETVVVKGDTDE